MKTIVTKGIEFDDAIKLLCSEQNVTCINKGIGKAAKSQFKCNVCGSVFNKSVAELARRGCRMCVLAEQRSRGLALINKNTINKPFKCIQESYVCINKLAKFICINNHILERKPSLMLAIKSCPLCFKEQKLKKQLLPKVKTIKIPKIKIPKVKIAKIKAPKLPKLPKIKPIKIINFKPRVRFRPSKDRAIELAKSNGGEFLSSSFNKARDKYEWKCANGHIFKTSFFHIRLPENLVPSMLRQTFVY